MALAATERSILREGPPGLWRLTGWAPSWVMAGVIGPTADTPDEAGPAVVPPHASSRRRSLPRAVRSGRVGALAPRHPLLRDMRYVIQAEQVHGSSIAVIHQVRGDIPPMAGCDALMTSAPGIGLVVRSADCLPIFLFEPRRRVVAIAHAGWRGLAANLPLRLVAAFRHLYHSRPEALRAAIGPAIRSCCYEVGPEFAARFGAFVQVSSGRRTCDLIGVAVEQLRRAGIAPRRILDSGQCTCCSSSPWYSIRREGQGTGRLLSFIAIR